MKINKLYILLLILATTLVACNEYEDTVVPGPTVSADNPAVRFIPGNATQYEFDPTGELSFVLKVIRDNPTAALEASLTVVTNTENAFEVPASVSFPAGEDTTTLTITVKPDAPTGVSLPLVISIGDQYANPYKKEYSTYTGKVSLIKWNNLGKVHFYDSFSFYSVAEVTLEQRDDIPTIYRITSPYTVGILTEAEWEGWIGGPTQDKILFTVNGNNVTWDKFWYTNLLYQGNATRPIKAYLPSARSAAGAADDALSVVVKDGDGIIQYFELYPYFYIDGVGGWGLNVVYLGFPGYDLAGELGIPVFVE